MATVTSETKVPTTTLRLASPNGPVTRTILQTPLRDALPSEIPMIDVFSIYSDSPSDRQRLADKIRDAAMNTGFFYIMRNGLSTDITDAADAACRDFFRQDLDVKMRAACKGDKFLNGYRAPETQRINPDEGIDVREGFAWRYDPHLDPTIPDVGAIPSHVSDKFGYNDHGVEQTSNVPQFRQAMVPHFQSCLGLARRLTRIFARSLDLPEDAFDSKVQYPDCALGINYYPPIAEPTAPSDPEARVSIGSHTDFQLFTILWQDDVGGLQVLNRDGQWIRAPPVRGSLIVNIADYMQRITNDRYVSTVHRAQNWSGQERLSIAFFFGFGLHESCGVLESCVEEGEEPKYPEINCQAWIQKRVGDMLKLDDK